MLKLLSLLLPLLLLIEDSLETAPDRLLDSRGCGRTACVCVSIGVYFYISELSLLVLITLELLSMVGARSRELLTTERGLGV